jgi:pimeloyl-ACP methyl ester carboxylesterase
VLENPDSRRIQRALINYYTNLDQYPTWQAYLRKHQPAALIVWGKGDQIFLPPGAEAYKRDLPKAEIHFFNTVHFALEEDASGIADQIIRFLRATKVKTALLPCGPQTRFVGSR